jgi:hypothetical protein
LVRRADAGVLAFHPPSGGDDRPKMGGHGWGFHINVINLKSKKK